MPRSLTKGLDSTHSSCTLCHQPRQFRQFSFHLAACLPNRCLVTLCMGMLWPAVSKPYCGGEQHPLPSSSTQPATSLCGQSGRLSSVSLLEVHTAHSSSGFSSPCAWKSFPGGNGIGSPESWIPTASSRGFHLILQQMLAWDKRETMGDRDGVRVRVCPLPPQGEPGEARRPQHPSPLALKPAQGCGTAACTRCCTWPGTRGQQGHRAGRDTGRTLAP